jgi:SNF2 family DNA or RNA helicase
MVRVRKFVVEDSVEERIVELQRKKKGMANEVYSDMKPDGTMSSARLSVDDFKLIFSNLVGS